MSDDPRCVEPIGKPYCEPGPCRPAHRLPVGHELLECVVVCDGYSDFLAHTLPTNKALFDRIVVVTSYEDKATQKLCEFHHVQVVATDRLETRKGKFCKGCGINDGMAALSLAGWVVHLDADIWLPPQTRVILQQLELDSSSLYGADRFIVKGHAAWQQFTEHPQLQHECKSWVHLQAFPMGTRVYGEGGYIPIGFFQLWCPQDSGVKRYPENHSDAGRTDMQFARMWPRARRHLLPELVCYHLESVDSGFQANWNGRVTAPFTGVK